jgi:hypothetical protein
MVMVKIDRIFRALAILFLVVILIGSTTSHSLNYSNIFTEIDKVPIEPDFDSYILVNPSLWAKDSKSTSISDITKTTLSSTRADLVTFINVTPTVGLNGISGNFFAWGDYNNDGNQDLLVNGGRLFRNNGLPDYTFTEVTQATGITGNGNGAFADYDNDGYLDFYCTGTDTLWHNLGAPDYKFEDATIDAGLTRDEYPTTAVGWSDFDLDGYLDMYITNGEDWNDGNPIYYPDFMFHNKGDGTFTDITSTSGIRNYGGPYYGRGVAWGDYDNDGWPDVYISNYRISQNWLFHNNRNGTFRDLSFEKGVAGEESQRMGVNYYGHTVGSAWADMDNDGDLDLFESNLVHKDLYRGPICGDSQLYSNNGPANDHTFTNMRDGSGIPEKSIGGGEDELFVGIAIADFDNDGFQDIFIPQIYDLDYSYSYLYHNDGDWSFTNVSDDVSVLVWNTYGGAWCDYNNDGFVDLITGGKGSADPNASYEVHLYKNNGNTNSWLQIKLAGKHYNKNAIGVKVKVSASNGLVQIREVEAGMGCHSSQNSIPLEFGFGSYTGTVTVEVTWPSGFVQKLDNVNLNQMLNIEESAQAPDLQFINVKILEDHPVSGNVVTIEASVVNMGFLTSESAIVRFYDGGPGTAQGGTEIADAQEIIDLEKFHSAKVSTVWDTTGYSGERNLWAVIEEVSPGELVINNNAMNKTIFIRAENQAPVARLTANPIKDLYINDIIHFDGSNSTDDIAVELYLYDFGDGNSSGWVADSEIYYQYSKGGKFTSTLKVKDNDEAISKSTASVTLTINSFGEPNQAPVIDRFTANPMEVNVLETVNLKVLATDPDSDELTYHFTASVGELITNQHSSSASWQAPETPGSYTINAKVFDGDLYSEPVKVEIKVIQELKNHIPEIESIQITPTTVVTGSTATIIVLATDPDQNIGDSLVYSYDVSGGSISGTGKSVTWLVPNEPDVYFITVTITDTGGLSTEDELMVNVIDPDYEPELSNGLVEPAIIKNNKLTSIVFTINVDDKNGMDDISSVIIDLSPIGGKERQEMYDTGKNGDFNSNDGIYSYEFLVSGGISTGEKVLTVTVRDLMGNEETENLRLTVEAGKTDKEQIGGFLPGFEISILFLCIMICMFYLSRKNKIY